MWRDLDINNEKLDTDLSLESTTAWVHGYAAERSLRLRGTDQERRRLDEHCGTSCWRGSPEVVEEIWELEKELESSRDGRNAAERRIVWQLDREGGVKTWWPPWNELPDSTASETEEELRRRHSTAATAFRSSSHTTKRWIETRAQRV